MIRPALTFSIAATLLSGCASANLGDRTVGQTVERDETFTARMVRTRKEAGAEMALKESPARITDPALEAYVQALTAEVSGEFADEVRPYIVRSASFNAFMLPNGAMGVNSGLLVRAETEDELALVLGHEFGHYLAQHSLEREIQQARGTNRTGAVGAVGVLAGAAAGVNLGLAPVALAMMAGDFSFSRSQEKEADDIGLRQARATGYDPGTAIRLWKHIDEEKSQSTLRKQKKNNAFTQLYASHPTSEARLKRLKSDTGIGGDIPRASREARSAYRARIRPYLLAWLADDVARGDTGATLALLDRLDDLGEDMGVLTYARARVIDSALTDPKLKGSDRVVERVAEYSPETVIELLERARTFPDAPATTDRDLAIKLLAAGRRPEAEVALARYLATNPSDAGAVKARFGIT